MYANTAWFIRIQEDRTNDKGLLDLNSTFVHSNGLEGETTNCILCNKTKANLTKYPIHSNMKSFLVVIFISSKYDIMPCVLKQRVTLRELVNMQFRLKYEQ